MPASLNSSALRTRTKKPRSSSCGSGSMTSRPGREVSRNFIVSLRHPAEGAVDQTAAHQFLDVKDALEPAERFEVQTLSGVRLDQLGDTPFKCPFRLEFGDLLGDL